MRDKPKGGMRQKKKGSKNVEENKKMDKKMGKKTCAQ